MLFLLDRALQTERPKRNCQVSYAQDNDEDRFPSGLIQKVLILLSQVFRGLFYKALPENVPAGVSAKKCSNSELASTSELSSPQHLPDSASFLAR